MNKSLIAAVATAASLLAAGTAQASDVHWSIGINLPPVATVISSAPVYAPAPIYAPAPVYAPPPPPVVYAPAPVVYAPPQRVVYPVPVVYGPRHHHGWGDRDHDGIPNRYDRYDNRRDRHEYRDYRDERKYRH